MIERVEAPGVNSSSTPAFFSSGYVLVRDDAAGEHGNVAGPLLLQQIQTRGNSVMWAPERMDSETASTSSWMAVATTISGV